MKEFLKEFSLSNSPCFYLFAILFALIIRLVLCFFKAFAHQSGETVENDQHEKKEVEKAKKVSWKTHFWQSFKGFGGTYKTDDYWLPFIIGFTEFVLLPILLFQFLLLNVVGAWFGFKALVNWSTRNSRTAYNRFLLGNILMIIFSYLLWHCFIGKTV